MNEQIGLTRIPSGLPTLDMVTRGGFPEGSLILLLGEIGSGHTEFAYTSAMMLAHLKSDPDRWNEIKSEFQEMSEEELKLPDRVCYVSFIKSEKDILQELTRTFNQSYVNTLQNHMFFKDFSPTYHRCSSITPTTWITEEQKPTLASLKGEGTEINILEELTDFLDIHAPNNMVILDSLTNLIRASIETIGWKDFVSFLEGLQRISKKWGGAIYLLLGSGIIEERQQWEIADCVDGVLIFEWEQRGASYQQQTMYVKKFRGILPQLARDDIVKFETTVKTPEGFEMVHVKRVMGRR